jgi:hypothetical protein
LQAAVGTASQAALYSREIGRIRAELMQLCELPDSTGVIFSPSGTDVHAIAAHYAVSGAMLPPRIVMMEANETGKGVAAALHGAGRPVPELVQVPVRLGDGRPRVQADIAADVDAQVGAAVASGRRVLLIVIDQSKTGLIAPSIACVLALQRRFAHKLEVLVDACQFRVAPATLRAYLEHDFMVALTGSKFLTGPSFSAALLVPPQTAQRLALRPFPKALAAGSNRANWPLNWAVTEPCAGTANFGLLLRWEAALHELRRFRTVPQAQIVGLLNAVAAAIQQRLREDRHFEPLPTPQLDRRPLIAADSWDRLQTIFPFLLHHANAERTPLSAEETGQVYRQLSVDLNENRSLNLGQHEALIAAMPCQLGQAVACGLRNGVAVSALRLCISSRLMVKAVADGDNGAAVIAGALTVLDKTALLIRLLPQLTRVDNPEAIVSA